jgi:hypothetical protein
MKRPGWTNASCWMRRILAAGTVTLAQEHRGVGASATGDPQFRHACRSNGRSVSA